MTFVRCAAVLLALGPLASSGGPRAGSAGPYEPATRRGVALSASVRPLSIDTLRATAEPGTPLLLTLPSSLAKRPVERYVLLEGPALSGVAGRSFTWIPQGAEPGTHTVLLHARHRTPPPDTLVLRIDLQS